MIIKCLYNTGEILMQYDRKPLGISQNTQYGELKIGNEYLVMGIIMAKGYLSFLINDGRVISACPVQLFEVIDSHVPTKWFFRNYLNTSNNYENMESVFGYYELCYDENHYEKLIEMDYEAHRIYFRRKIEMEKEQDNLN